MNIKNIFLTAFFSLLIVFAVSQTPAQATSGGNIFGTMWSDNVGWISFNNCTDATTCSGIDYGVTMQTTTGKLSGYAWSSNAGWISFDSSAVNGCPSGTCASAVNWNANKTSATISGWARACSVFTSGCNGTTKGTSSGFIDLSGLTVDSAGTIGGNSWGSDIFGWLSPVSLKILNVCPAVPVKPTGYCSNGTTVNVTDSNSCIVGYSCTCSAPTPIFDSVSNLCVSNCIYPKVYDPNTKACIIVGCTPPQVWDSTLKACVPNCTLPQVLDTQTKICINVSDCKSPKIVDPKTNTCVSKYTFIEN